MLLIEEEPQDMPVTEESREKAKLLVARGLQAAMQAPPATPEQVWAEFDRVRAKIQDAVERSRPTSSKNVT